MTDAEWAELRRLRACLAPARMMENKWLLCLYPQGPWDPEDQRFFEEACRLVANTPNDGGYQDLHEYLAAVAADKGDPAHLPLLQALAEGAGDNEHDVRMSIRELRKKAGLTPEDTAEPSSSAPTDAEGHSEEDEDGDW